MGRVTVCVQSSVKLEKNPEFFFGVQIVDNQQRPLEEAQGREKISVGVLH